MEKEDPNLLFYLAEIETGTDLEYGARKIEVLLGLDNIPRFSQEPMVHRSSVLDHSVRVELLALHLGDYLQKVEPTGLNFYKISRLAKYHDLPELITGDYPTPVKDQFSPEEREELDRQESSALKRLAIYLMPEHPEHWELFIQDWLEIKAKKTPESQIVDIADKLDALCEVITDIRCGNDTPEIDVVYKKYLKKFHQLQKQYPIMKELSGFGLPAIPSLAEARNLSKIDLNLLSPEDKGRTFWQQVFDPELPLFYWDWLARSTNRNTFDMGVFTRWKDTLKQYPLSPEMWWELTYGREKDTRAKTDTDH